MVFRLNVLPIVKAFYPNGVFTVWEPEQELGERETDVPGVLRFPEGLPVKIGW